MTCRAIAAVILLASFAALVAALQVQAPDAGLALEVLKDGDGKTFPKKGDTLTMHYTGTLAGNGVKFDSSRDRKQPFQFTIGEGEVIKGWDYGVMKMSLGERGVLHVPSAFGYGATG